LIYLEFRSGVCYDFTRNNYKELLVANPKRNFRADGSRYLTKDYRREAFARRRKNIGADKVNEENRKSYHRRIARLQAIQRGEIEDTSNEIEKFVKGRMLRAAKHRAKKNGLEFNLVAADIQLPKTCPVSGVVLQVSVQGPDSRKSYSLDRLDNAKGYVKGNVRVISREVNAIKGSHDIAFFERLIAYMKGEL
jgi:hypothetical protein